MKPELELKEQWQFAQLRKLGDSQQGEGMSGHSSGACKGVQCGSQSVVWGPLWVPETHLGALQGQNYFHSNTKTLFAFLTLILSLVYRGVFQRFQDVCYPNRWNAKPDMRI